MKKSSKFYIFLILLTSVVFIGSTQTSNYYENTVSASVCEGDSNIIKAGCSVAVGQVVRVTPGIVTGVTLDKMKSCWEKYGPTSGSAGGVIIDLNDPCNQIAFLNPTMQKERYAYVPFDENSVFSNSRPGIGSLASIMEVSSKQATDGLLMNREFYAANTFKNVPYLKTSFAATTNPFNRITEIVYNIWLITRNLAYVILLVGALILGIIIMLGNQNIDKDGKIKLTVERAIPRVVLAVILISSSYWLGELILNTLVSGGIVQGIAAFFISSIISVDVTSSAEPSVYLSFPVITLIMGVVAGALASTAGSAIIPIIVAIIFAVWRFLLVNYLIIKNIIAVLVYIIISPLILVRGVQPSQNQSEAFKEYFAKLLYFIITGFALNLILYGSKGVLLLGTLLFGGIDDPTSLVNAITESTLGGYGAVAWVIIWIFSVILCVYVLGLANKVEEKASALSLELAGAKKPAAEKKD
jgi:hypothetical protein